MSEYQVKFAFMNYSENLFQTFFEKSIFLIIFNALLQSIQQEILMYIIFWCKPLLFELWA